VSHNTPFTLSKEAFGGLPTTACVEASLRKVAVFCTDELKLNDHFIDNEEIVIIPHEADRIVRISESFQKKCRDKMNQFKAEGKTMVFVSHALDAVKKLCQRTVLLNEGRIVTMGDTEKVINDYLTMLQTG
jgi:ABC-type Na+ transport system ATPase subunit NatA